MREQYGCVQHAAVQHLERGEVVLQRVPHKQRLAADEGEETLLRQVEELAGMQPCSKGYITYAVILECKNQDIYNMIVYNMLKSQKTKIGGHSQEVLQRVTHKLRLAADTGEETLLRQRCA